MYNITDSYKNHIENITSLSPKSKIVVDGVEYTGSKLKTTPKIKHQNTSLIGGFPIKTCSFEIYDLENNLDFENKEIFVYKGLAIEDKIEYILQGIFIPTADKIKTNITERTISFEEIQDKSQLFDTKYESNLDWTENHTGLEIIKEICDKLEIPLDSLTFNFSDYIFKQPNFITNISNREVVSKMAEIGGSIAVITRDGKLAFKSQFQTNHTIERKRYGKVTKEKVFGPINTLILGKDGIDDDIVFPYNLPEEKVEWKITDNPFVDLYRGEMIEKVAANIIGKCVIPFSLTDFVDGFYLDLNDVIKIKDKTGDIFEGVILSYESTGRIKSKIETKAQEVKSTNYSLAGSQKQALRDVKFQVNYNDQRITSLVQESDNQRERMSIIEQDIDGIKQEISDIEDFTKIITGTNIIIDDAIDYQMLGLSVKGYSKLIGNFLYPSGNLFGSSSLFPSKDREVENIKNLTLCISDNTNIREYELKVNGNLRSLGNVYDELIINFDIKSGKFEGQVIRKLEVIDGDLRIRNSPITEEIEIPNIILFKGYNHIYFKETKNYEMTLKYIIYSERNEAYATKIELNSSITQTKDEINLEVSKKVDENEIISKINQSAEQIQIEANKISLTGKEINLTSDEIIINSNNFSVNKEGNITAKSGVIGGFNLTDSDFSVDVNGIYNYSNFDLALAKMEILHFTNYDSYTLNILDADNNGEFALRDVVELKQIVDGLHSSSKTVNGSFKINSKDPKNCVSFYNDNAPIVQIGAGGINSLSGVFQNIVCSTIDNNSSTDVPKVVINGPTGTIYYSGGLNQSSLAEIKKNFEKVDSVLSIIKDTDIYKYNLNFEDDNHKKHYGLVIGESFNYSQEVTTDDNSGVDLYSMISVCFQAIKEQQEIIERLSNDLEFLKSKNSKGSDTDV